MTKKSINLRDRQEVLALMKILYGTNEVKDDTKVYDSHRESGAKSSCEVVKPSSGGEGLLLQE